MRSVREYIISVLLLVLLPVLPMSAADEPETGQDGFSAKDVVLGHFEDSYWWHIGTFGDREVALYLPMILHSKATGWHCFSSRNLRYAAPYEGFSIASDSNYKGKSVAPLPDASVARHFE